MEKINVAELLKDCPKGMELDCTLWDNVEFMEVDTESDTIILRVGNKFIRRLNKYGQEDNVDCAKCVIFPKGKTTWEGFSSHCKFKDGDVVVDDTGAIFLYSKIHPHYEEQYADFYCGLTSKLRAFIIKTAENQHCGKITSIRFATEEEREKLFEAIKENGYKWNAETKTLEKLVIPKFDITTLKPFESRVLARDNNTEKWKSNFWGFYDSDHAMNYPYECCGTSFMQCIPYNDDTKHLLGKTDDCDDFYKTWE